MADITNELIFELLKKMQADLGAVKKNVEDLKVGQTQLMHQMAGVRRDYADGLETSARLSARSDHADARLDRIERRLEISDA